MIQEEEKVHSKVGASSAKRWMNCPGSIALLEQVARKPNSKYAAEGTVAHGVAEKMFDFGIPGVLPKDNGQLGRVVIQDGFEIEITVAMIEGATLYAETIFNDMIEQGLPDPYKEYKSGSGNGRVFKPHRVFEFLNIEKGFCLKSIDKELFGTNDASICVPFGKLTVYDYKYGAGVAVDVVENEQLLFYALGVVEEMGGLDTLCLQEVELVIIQPRAQHRDGPIRRWQTTPERLAEFAQTLKVKLKDARDPNAVTKSGSWCKFCDAKTICQSARNEVNRTAQMEFAPVDYDAKLAERYTNVEPPKVEDMTKEQIANVLDKASMVQDWIKTVETKAMEMLKQGLEVPGYKLVGKKGHRAWADESLVVEAFDMLYGDKIYTERKLLSPAQLEKIVGKESVKEYTMVPDAGYTVVKETDKRQGVIPAVNDFEAIEQIVELDL